MKKTPLRRVSKRRAGELKEYMAMRKAFLQDRVCVVCDAGGIYTCRATEVHHKDGRNGRRLVDFSKCIPVCRDCHNWIHANPGKARKKGYLI